MLPFAVRLRSSHGSAGAWRGSRRGHGRVVMVVGEAGIGKTRLIDELAREALQQGDLVLLDTALLPSAPGRQGLVPHEPAAAAIQTGGRLIRHARYFTLQLAESYLTGARFRQILQRVERLGWYPT